MICRRYNSMPPAVATLVILPSFACDGVPPLHKRGTQILPDTTTSALHALLLFFVEDYLLPTRIHNAPCVFLRDS